MEKNRGLIFDIQSFSVHDGPGTRTTVFLKGCPLRCEWCANPEGWNPKRELMFASMSCKLEGGCHACIGSCTSDAVKQGSKTVNLDYDKCAKCSTFECTSVCYNEALKVCGTWYSIPELMRILDRDAMFWDEKGGVTFSGGEVFYQKEFLKSSLIACKESFIHTAIETSAFAETKSFLEIMQYVDFAFIDVKHMDSIKHREKTGVPNEIILNNIRALVGSDWPGRLVLRVPIIAGFNDAEENMESTAGFMESLGLFEINLLPFHHLGASKWDQLNRNYDKYRNMPPTTSEKLQKLQDIFLSRHIACYTSSETPF